MSERLIVAGLGIGARESEYEFEGKRVHSSFSTVALYDLLPEDARPRRAVIAVTEKARKEAWDQFHEELSRRGVELTNVPIEDPRDYALLLSRLAREVPSESELMLDLTPGLRHLPFLFFALAQYLSALRNVRLTGAWYCMFEAVEEGKPKPMIDLSILLSMADRTRAVADLRDTGSPSRLARELRRTVAELGSSASTQLEDRKRVKKMRALASAVSRAAVAFESALPIDLGLAWARFVELVDSGGMDALAEALDPLGRELAERLLDEARPLAVAKSVIDRGRDGRIEVIDEQELERQARVIDEHLRHDRLATALLMMREWIVSRAAIDTGSAAKWREREVRQRIERRLGALCAAAADPNSGSAVRKGLSEDQRQLAKAWDLIARQRRNFFAHCGMTSGRPRWLDRDRASGEDEIEPVWRDLRGSSQASLDIGGGGGCLLVAPVGLSAGVLYSALVGLDTKPDRCLLIVTEASRPGAEEAARRAGFDLARIRWLVIEEAVGHFAEAQRVVREAEEELLHCDELVVCHTGGTTKMAYAAARIGRRARELDRPVRHIALLDRRPREMQDREPWHAAELEEIEVEG